MFNLTQAAEIEKYFLKRQNDLKRALDKTKTPQEKYAEIIKQQQEELEYYKKKQQQQRQQEEAEKDFLKEVEEKAASAVEEVLKNLLK